MVPLDKVRDWFAEHGYRDQVPRRDAVNPDVLFYRFVKDGRKTFGVRTFRRKIKTLYFEKIKKAMDEYEKGDPTAGS